MLAWPRCFSTFSKNEKPTIGRKYLTLTCLPNDSSALRIG